MGNRITSVDSPQGFAAESSSASVILASSYFGYPLSTTQVVSGGVLGAGLGKRLASVRWKVIAPTAGRGRVRLAHRALAGACGLFCVGAVGASDVILAVRRRP